MAKSEKSEAIALRTSHAFPRQITVHCCSRQPSKTTKAMISSTESSRKALVSGSLALTAVGLTSAYLYRRSKKCSHEKENALPFYKYDHPPMPMAIKLIAMLPKSIRQSMAVKGSKPAPPKDAFDVLGEDDTSAPNPYETAEIIPGKIYRVRYSFLANPKMAKVMKTLAGIDGEDSEAILANVPPEMKEIVAKDLVIAEKIRNMTEEELIQNKYCSKQDMLVAVLDTADASTNKKELVLYNPCRMRPYVMKWLDSLGTVTYIVSGSSAHTNQLCQASEAYPEAKIICAEAAEMKCMSVGMRASSYRYTNKEELDALNVELAKGGAKLHFVEGDTFTHAALVQVHNCMFECDLACYANHCGTRCFSCDSKMWNDSDSVDGMNGRLFYYVYFAPNVAPNKYIPVYRFMGLDASSPFSKLMIDEPKADGSSCAEMANSLRKILQLDFDMVLSAHSCHEKGIDGEEFRKTLDVSWGWLDGGRSLL